MKVFWALVSAMVLVGLLLVVRNDETLLGGDPRVRMSADSAEQSGPDTSARASSTAPTGDAVETRAGTHPRPSTDGRPGNSTALASAIPAPSAPSTQRSDVDTADEVRAPHAGASLVAATPRGSLSDATDDPAAIRRIDARTVELAGRFRVTGAGREDDPYRISWELLTSAQSVVDPARDALEPPAWVRLLDGTVIEISGYYSTAVRVQRASQVLLTLNRWDGCCIGLPPTPFDAIDCALRAPIELRGLHLVRFGTFRGRLVVEPFVVAGYLIGLYRLEDATFTTQ